MKYLFSMLMLAFLICSCEPETSGTGKMIQEIKTDGSPSNASIIRNPISADGAVDTINVAKMVFDDFKHNFGTVKEGDIVKHVYKFTNEGNVPLVIADARSTCGCTVPKWPKDAIEPGGKGVISVRFDTKAKTEKQSKPITIRANTNPKETVLQLHGFVTPKPTN